MKREHETLHACHVRSGQGHGKNAFKMQSDFLLYFVIESFQSVRISLILKNKNLFVINIILRVFTEYSFILPHKRINIFNKSLILCQLLPCPILYFLTIKTIIFILAKNSYITLTQLDV